MLEKIRNSVNLLVSTKALRNADEVYLFITMEMTAGLLAFLHLGYVAVYAYAKNPRMAWANVLCIAIAAVALTLVRSGRYYYAAGTLIMALALVYGTWSHFFHGLQYLQCPVLHARCGAGGAGTLRARPAPRYPWCAYIYKRYLYHGAKL